MTYKKIAFITYFIWIGVYVDGIEWAFSDSVNVILIIIIRVFQPIFSFASSEVDNQSM